MMKKILEIDPGRGQEDLKDLTSYICMNISEYYINVCERVRERERVAYLYFTSL